MATDMFLELKGIEGESIDKTYKDKKALDILAWSWGMSNSGTFHSGSGGGAGKANVQDLSFTKYIDKSSAPLMLACCNGKHLEEAVLTVRKAGEKPLEYLKLTMTQVMVTAVSTGGSGGEDRLTENVTLNFAKVKCEYFMQSKTGGKETGGQMSWDIAANANE
jgi:type VI secretion system secreted protein Hcp